MTKRSLLLVDGDARSLRVLEVSLRKAGFTVTTALTGNDALERVGLATPDLIISATHMDEGMNGFEFCQKLKESDGGADIPFIFLAEEDALEHKIRGLELGVEDYLTKPIYIKEIITRVRILLQKQERAELEEKRDTRTRFTGSLSDMGVVDLLQTIELSKKSGLIHVTETGTRQASVYFRDGQVVDAEAGRLRGEDAVYRLLTWSDGDFEVLFRSVRRRDVIQMSTQGLLMEGMRRLDEWGRLLEQLPPTGTPFQLDFDELAERLPDLPDELNSILRLFDGRRSLLDIVDDSLYSDLECLEIISRLYFEGVIIEARPQPSIADDLRGLEGSVVRERPLGRAIKSDTSNHVTIGGSQVPRPRATPKPRAAAETMQPPLPRPPADKERDLVSEAIGAMAPVVDENTENMLSDVGDLLADAKSVETEVWIHEEDEGRAITPRSWYESSKEAEAESEEDLPEIRESAAEAGPEETAVTEADVVSEADEPSIGEAGEERLIGEAQEQEDEPATIGTDEAVPAAIDDDNPGAALARVSVERVALPPVVEINRSSTMISSEGQDKAQAFGAIEANQGLSAEPEMSAETVSVAPDIGSEDWEDETSPDGPRAKRQSDVGAEAEPQEFREYNEDEEATDPGFLSRHSVAARNELGEDAEDESEASAEDVSSSAEPESAEAVAADSKDDVGPTEDESEDEGSEPQEEGSDADSAEEAEPESDEALTAAAEEEADDSADEESEEEDDSADEESEEEDSENQDDDERPAGTLIPEDSPPPVAAALYDDEDTPPTRSKGPFFAVLGMVLVAGLLVYAFSKNDYEKTAKNEDGGTSANQVGSADAQVVPAADAARANADAAFIVDAGSPADARRPVDAAPRLPVDAAPRPPVDAAPPRPRADAAPPPPRPDAAPAPTTPKELYNQAKSLRRKRKYKQALAAVDKSLAAGPSSRAHHLRAEILLAMRDLRGASQSADAAVQMSPRSSSAWKTKGMIHLDLGQNGKAKAALKRYLELRPNARDKDDIQVIVESL